MIWAVTWSSMCVLHMAGHIEPWHVLSSCAVSCQTRCQHSWFHRAVPVIWPSFKSHPTPLFPLSPPQRHYHQTLSHDLSHCPVVGIKPFGPGDDLPLRGVGEDTAISLAKSWVLQSPSSPCTLYWAEGVRSVGRREGVVSHPCIMVSWYASPPSYYRPFITLTSVWWRISYYFQ